MQKRVIRYAYENLATLIQVISDRLAQDVTPLRAPCDTWFTAVTTLAVACPFGVMIAKVLTVSWFPTWDLAVILLRAQDVGTRNTPLIGAYSRFGWNHPGPMFFYSLAPFARVFGANGLLVGSVAISLFALLTAILIVARYFGTRFAIVTSIVGLLLCAGLTPNFIVNPWNPTVPVLPFFAFVIAVWADLVHRGKTIIVSVILGSFAIQSHVGYTIVVAPLWIVEIGARVNDARQKGGQELDADPRSKRGGFAALVIGALIWTPPLIQQATSTPGNLSSLITYFSQSKRPTYGLVASAKTMSQILSPKLTWMTGEWQATPSSLLSKGSIVDGTIIVFAIVILAIATHRANEMRLCALCEIDLVLISAALIAISSISGDPFGYLAAWVAVIGATTWLTLLLGSFWLLRRAVQRWTNTYKSILERMLSIAWRHQIRVGLSIIIICATVLSAAAWSVKPPRSDASEVVGDLSWQASHHLNRRSKYLIEWADTRTFQLFTVGILAALEKQGYHTYVTQGGWIVGSHRVINPTKAVQTIRVLPSQISCGKVIPAGWTQIACTKGRGPNTPSRFYALALSPPAWQVSNS